MLLGILAGAKRSVDDELGSDPDAARIGDVDTQRSSGAEHEAEFDLTIGREDRRHRRRTSETLVLAGGLGVAARQTGNARKAVGTRDAATQLLGLATDPDRRISLAVDAHGRADHRAVALASRLRALQRDLSPDDRVALFVDDLDAHRGTKLSHQRDALDLLRRRQL